jgi:pimeloyl-ACP methyl ester carboxylesterase
MNPRTFSIVIALVALIAMGFVALPIFTERGASFNSIHHLEKNVCLSTGVTLSYAEQGRADGIPIILLHGFTDSWHSFEYVMDKFPDSFRVFAISQRGHGNSSKTARTDDTKYFAGDIAAFIKKKGLGPCIIVGHSLGGLITQRFALDYPELTKAIVIEASEASFVDNSGMPEFIAELKKLSDPVDPGFAKAFQWSTITKPMDSTVVNKFIGESMKVPAQVWNSVGDLLLTTDFSNELTNIHAPALILWGDRDTICLNEGQTQLSQGLDSSELVIFKGTGHALHWEDEDRFVKEVTKFVERLE